MTSICESLLGVHKHDTLHCVDGQDQGHTVIQQLTTPERCLPPFRLARVRFGDVPNSSNLARLGKSNSKSSLRPLFIELELDLGIYSIDLDLYTNPSLKSR